MAILNFHKRFAGKVKNGRKRQTIRAVRKYPIKVGETLYLYTGLRSKNVKKLRIVKCSSVENIHIHFNQIPVIILPEEIIDSRDLNAFAKLDGFKDWADMKRFWIEKHGDKIFVGQLIKW